MPLILPIPTCVVVALLDSSYHTVEHTISFQVPTHVVKMATILYIGVFQLYFDKKTPNERAVDIWGRHPREKRF